MTTEEIVEISQFQHEGITYCCRGDVDEKFSGGAKKCDLWNDSADDYFYHFCSAVCERGYDPYHHKCPQPMDTCPGPGKYRYTKSLESVE